MNNQPPGWIYFFLCFGAFMENVFPPIPGDTLIVFGAYLAGIGVIGVWPAYFAMWVGSAVGCLLVYGVAFWKGRSFFLRLNLKFLNEENLDSAETWFTRYGDKIVVFNRFLPTVRAFVGIVAGISQMHPVRMTLYVLVGTFLWNSLLVYFGLMVGENWQLVIDVMKTYNRVLAVLMVAGGIGFWWWRRKKKAEEARVEYDDRIDRQA
ncbi:MAG: DedA family protein [Candidatus Latescibacteria bacterium]|nr:DedA family protein [Candidatus Latescibacterota bacterium]